MTIDEAIAEERDNAKTQREIAEQCFEEHIFEEKERIEHLRYANEFEQIAEWLEELKAYRQYIDLTEIPEQYKLGFQDGIIAGNNKAIDDFVNACKEDILCQTFGLHIKEIERIAEQLKAGEDNGKLSV